MKVPLLTAQQADDADAGKEVTAAVVVKTDYALTEKCNQDVDHCLIGVAFRGVTQPGLGRDLGDEDKKILNTHHIVVDDKSTMVDMSLKPEGYGFNLFIFVLAIAAGLGAVLMPGGRRRGPPAPLVGPKGFGPPPPPMPPPSHGLGPKLPG